MTRHTLGPWEENDSGCYTATERANARLIAAAPDLLAALERAESRIQEAYEAACDKHGYEDMTLSEDAETLLFDLVAIKQAIAKATGA